MTALRGALFFALLAACGTHQPAPPAGQITVAAAANLTGVLEEICAAFTEQTGIGVVLSYGSTAQLAQQIENAAPFDVFAAADVEHVDALVKQQLIAAGTRAVYARGQLALWVPRGDALRVHALADLTEPAVRFISIARPSVAPYGKAAEEALQRAWLWDKLQPKIVYAPNINMAKQQAASGNADAAFTAYSLVQKERGQVILVDAALYAPIDQALAVVAQAKNPEGARRFTAYLLSASGQAALRRHGYLAAP